MKLESKNLKPGDLFYHRYPESNYEWIVRFTIISEGYMMGDYHVGLNGETTSSSGYSNVISTMELKIPTKEQIKRFEKQFPGVDFTIPNGEPEYEIY